MIVADRDTFDALRGGLPSQEESRWFHDMYDRSVSRLGEGRRNFVEKATKAYQRVTENRAAQIVRNLKTRVKRAFSGGIETLDSLEEFQSAKPYMRRWVMAHTGIRSKFLRGEAEGYGLDIAERLRVTGEKLEDYRNVMQGIHLIPEEGDAYYKVYHDIEDTPLAFHERVTISNIWARLDKFIDDEGEDPTSPYGADLG